MGSSNGYEQKNGCAANYKMLSISADFEHTENSFSFIRDHKIIKVHFTVCHCPMSSTTFVPKVKGSKVKSSFEPKQHTCIVGRPVTVRTVVGNL